MIYVFHFEPRFHFVPRASERERERERARERERKKKEREKIMADLVLLSATHDGTERRSPPPCSKLSPLSVV